MKTKIIPVCLAVILVFLIAGCTQSGGGGGGSGTHNVAISSYAFVSSNITINKGETVIWTNEDPTSHTVTSDSGSELSSGPISTGQTYTHTFNQAGVFTYHCSIHQTMKATVTVE